MRKVAKFLLLMFFCFCFPLIVKANSIDNIDMDIYIDKNGTAHVTEVWNANLNSGTEGYKPYYDLGDAKINNFKVSEDDEEYTYKESWNIDASFNDKAYKNGVNYTKNGIELCWGISEYGYHSYKLTYDIEGFVVALSDADMIYWQLIPYNLSSKPGNVHIKIYSDDKYDDELLVRGYGKYGAPIHVYDGYIEMSSNGELNSNEYMIILVKFNKETFNTYNIIDKSFDYYLNKANLNSKPYKEKDHKNIDSLYYNHKYIFMFLMTLFYVAALLLIIYVPNAIIKKIILYKKKKIKNYIESLGTNKLNFGKNGKKIPNDIPIFRDIPFKKDIYKAFWVANNYKLSNKKTDFLGAILLKWLLQKKISLESESKKSFIEKISEAKKEAIVLLPKNGKFYNETEFQLYEMMYNASNNGILKSKSFEKWCKRNYRKIFKWFNTVIDLETNSLKEEGKIILNDKDVYIVDECMKNEAIKLKGFKNFLEEFSRIGEKEAIEVNMWEYYLIYAQILGIADKVAKQFKKLYPELSINDAYINSNNNFFDDFDLVRSFSNRSIHGVNSFKKYMYSTSYSSDDWEISSKTSGGYSSGGGGGGSFGSGGGGGGFR